MADDSGTKQEVSDEAILVPEFDQASTARRQLTYSAVGTIAVAVVFLLLAMTFGETLGFKHGMDEEFEGDWWNTPLHLRHQMDLPMDTLRAQLPVNGTYEASALHRAFHRS